MDGGTDGWTHPVMGDAPSLTTFRPNKVEDEQQVEHEPIFPPPGGKNSRATTNILFFSIINEYKVTKSSDLIHYPPSHKFKHHLWSLARGFLSNSDDAEV